MPEEWDQEGVRSPAPKPTTDEGHRKQQLVEAEARRHNQPKLAKKTEQKTRRHRQLESNLKLVLKGLK